MLACFLDMLRSVKAKKIIINIQTPKYSFLSICFIWQSSNSDSSHSIYSSSSNLPHVNLSSEKLSLQNHCSTTEGSSFPDA